MGFLSDAFGSITDLFDGNSGSFLTDTLGNVSAAASIASTGSPGGFNFSSLLGPLISAGGSLLGSQMTNSANQADVASQEAFQADMSNTAYQRTTADMEAAGLNPMLAVSNGGASTPSGGLIPAVNSLGNATNSALDAYTAQANAANISKQGQLLDAQTASTLAQATKTESGSLMSDVVGSTAAGKFSNYINSALDGLTGSPFSVINGVNNSSASSASKKPVFGGAGASASLTGSSDDPGDMPLPPPLAPPFPNSAF